MVLRQPAARRRPACAAGTRCQHPQRGRCLCPAGALWGGIGGLADAAAARPRAGLGASPAPLERRRARRPHPQPAQRAAYTWRGQAHVAGRRPAQAGGGAAGRRAVRARRGYAVHAYPQADAPDAGDLSAFGHQRVVCDVAGRAAEAGGAAGAPALCAVAGLPDRPFRSPPHAARAVAAAACDRCLPAAEPAAHLQVRPGQRRAAGATGNAVPRAGGGAGTAVRLAGVQHPGGQFGCAPEEPELPGVRCRHCAGAVLRPAQRGGLRHAHL
ncbi:hypothetical protein D9M72_310580 [compost metagenome]